MNESEAISLAQAILNTDLANQGTIDGLLRLEPFISKDIFGDLFEALVAICPQELIPNL